MSILNELKPEVLNLIHIVLYCFASLSPLSTASFNLPIYLFGMLGIYFDGSNSPLKLFTALSVMTILIDIIWFILHGSGGFLTSSPDSSKPGYFTFAMVLTVLSLILKPLSIHRTWGLIMDRGDDGALHIDWSSPKTEAPLMGGPGHVNDSYQNAPVV